MSKSITVAFGYICLGLFLIGIGFIRFGPLFQIRSVDCRIVGATSCPPEVTAELNRFRQTFIFYLPVEALSSRLKAALPTVHQVTVKVLLPNRVLVELIPDKPWLQVTLVGDPQIYRLSSFLRVLAMNTVPDPALMTVGVNLPLKIYLGQRIDDPAFTFVVDVLRLTALNGITVTAATLVSPSLIVLNLTSGYQAVMTSQSDATRQVTALQLVLSKATMNPSLPVIDVRFAKPILKPDLEQ